MDTSNLDLLIGQRGDSCLSVIIPTYKFVALKTLSQAVIKKHIIQATDILMSYHSRHPEKKVDQLLPALEKSAATIETTKYAKGIGLFISPNVNETVYFPFEVKEKISLGRSFELRELLLCRDHLSEFFVLALSKKTIRLFGGNAEALAEVTNADFPMNYEDDYEYTKPSRGTSYGNAIKSFERDKATLSEIRQKEFLSEADNQLTQYVKDSVPFIVVGATELISNFNQLTKHNSLKADTIVGNFNHNVPAEVSKRLREGKLKCQIAKIESIPDWLENEFGKNLVAEGIESVWKAAEEGNGQMLVVEKDYQCPGYLRSGERHKLFVGPPKGDHEIVPDAVNEVMAKVIEKGGKIVFVENDKLRKFDHIAMHLRYQKVKSAVD
jgi:Bacterial archaeo-eukaryotic release factor family 3